MPTETFARIKGAILALATTATGATGVRAILKTSEGEVIAELPAAIESLVAHDRSSSLVDTMVI